MQHPEIDQYIAAVEKDILKAKALLEKGYETSLIQLKNAIVEVDRTHRKIAKLEIRAAVSSGREALDKVEHCIGQMDFLNAHQKIDGLGEFDDLFAQLSEALKAAKLTVAFALKSTKEHTTECEGELKSVWTQLHLYLEVVRLEIAMAAHISDEEMPEVRAKLCEIFGKAAISREPHQRRKLLESTRHLFDEEEAIIKDNLIEILSEHPELAKWITKQSE